METKDLNTIVLGTSRRNVEQSIGRILRKQKGNYLVQPLVIDIVDNLKTFVNQSYTRKAYYKKITNLENIFSYKYQNGEIIEEKRYIKKEDGNKSEDEDIFEDSD